MQKGSELFDYDASGLSPGADRLVAEVPAGISTAAALLSALAKFLLFPSYFGFNWDALSDCLRDFHWVDKKEVVVVHGDLPSLPDAELGIYLEVLAEACESWKPDEEHSLRVVFPASARPEITRRLGAPS